MLRQARLALAAAAVIVLPTAASAGQASTIRIEPRPFYGATVTLEEGVRVFRALPADQKVIINPGGRTPLSLGIDESTSHNYYYDRTAARDGGGSDAAGAYGGFYGAPGPRGRHKPRVHGVGVGHHGAHGHPGHGMPGGGRGH